MDYDYPILQKVFNYFNEFPHDIGNCYLVCCQHLLEPQLKMFEYLIDFGFDPNKIIILGKAYSTNTYVLQELKNKGLEVFQPEFFGKSFDEEHKNNCDMISKLIPEEMDIIILDDGAELITSLSGNRKVLFAIEQTSSGFRKLENIKLNFPVINIARSVTKLTQESPFIARLCFERIKDYFYDKKINNPSILIVGLGPIGESIFEIFKQNNFLIEGFDVKYGQKNLQNIIINTTPDIIIGAAGSSILTRANIEEISSINKPFHLISVSSSDREFPVAYFRKDKIIHDDVKYKKITFVNNGFPITFKGNENENTPIEMEKTICLLGGSIMYGTTNIINGKGLINVPEKLEKLIN